MCSHSRLPAGSAGVSMHLPRASNFQPWNEQRRPSVLDAAVGEVGAAVRAMALHEAVAVPGLDRAPGLRPSSAHRLDRPRRPASRRPGRPAASSGAAACRRRARPDARHQLVLLGADHLDASTASRVWYFQAARSYAGSRGGAPHLPQLLVAPAADAEADREVAELRLAAPNVSSARGYHFSQRRLDLGAVPAWRRPDRPVGDQPPHAVGAERGVEALLGHHRRIARANGARLEFSNAFR